MAEESTKLKLHNVKVVFYNPVDEGFGTSITIDCTEKEVHDAIADWVKRNNIGKDEPGVPKFKSYAPEGKEPTEQFAFKINDYTKYAGMNGLGKDDIGYGARVDLVAGAFEYNNKFTGGKTRIGQSVSAVLVKSAATSGGDADLAELLGEAAESPESEETVSGIQF